jgi:hypothetical protein|tara:strand:+ start:274 stop:564 length:291 start_codon:yes stop_codon:yes gene_type:complete
MTYVSVSAKPGHITVQRVVYDGFTSINLKIVDNNNSELNLVVCDGTAMPRITELSAYIADEQCDDADTRARYPLFLPQITDVDLHEMNKEWEAICA